MANIDDIKNVLYEDCPFTKFPDAVDNIARKEDVRGDTVLEANIYAQYVANNDMAGAAAYLESHPRLVRTLVGADYLNQLRDGLVAVERIFNGYIADYIAHVVKNKGTWNSLVQYNKYDLVFYSIADAQTSTIPQAFMALPVDEETTTIPIGTLPTDEDYWVQITIQGTRFTPSTEDIVTVEGLRGKRISWSNTDGLTNPDSADIMDGVRYMPNSRDYTVPGTESYDIPLEGKTIYWTHNGEETIPVPDPVNIINGVTYTPSETRINGGWRISWSNNGGATNPDPIDVLNGQSGAGYSPRGSYDSGERYYKDDIVIYNNIIWYAKSEVSGETPSDSSAYWGRFGNISMSFDYYDFNMEQSDWTNNTDTDQGIYPYKYVYYIPSVGVNSRVDALFDEASKLIARDAIISTTTDTIQGGVVLKSTTIPTGDLTGQFVIFQNTEA